MAQRTVHMLFAVLAADRVSVNDKNRFFIGSLLPDAYQDPAERKKAHFIRYLPDENSLYFDFHAYLDLFHDRVIRDDLYLGYYAHLVGDAFYRYYLYYEKKLMARLQACQLDVLHDDYRILNAFIARNYDMPVSFTVPEDFDREQIHTVTRFDIAETVRAYQDDLTVTADGHTVYLTEDMLREFADRYSGPLAAELNSVRSGGSLLDPLAYRWENKNRSDTRK